MLGLMNPLILTEAIKHPERPINRPAVLFYTDFMVILPLFIESILLFRVYVVYPPRLIPFSRALTIYIPLIVLKLARLTNDIVFIVQFSIKSRGVGDSTQLSPLAFGMPGCKIEWILQVIDNTTISAFFLWRLHEVKSFSLRFNENQSSGARRYQRRLAMLFWIAAGNFVFPVFFAIAQVILIMAWARSFNQQTDVLIILITNTYVAIYGVLFATLWAASSNAEATTVSDSVTDMEFAVSPPIRSRQSRLSQGYEHGPTSSTLAQSFSTQNVRGFDPLTNAEWESVGAMKAKSENESRHDTLEIIDSD